MKKIITILLLLSFFVCNSMVFEVFAEGNYITNELEKVLYGTQNQSNNYYNYAQTNASEPIFGWFTADNNYVTNYADVETNKEIRSGTKADLVYEDGQISYQIDSQADGLYQFGLQYYSYNNILNLELGILIDGKFPFKEATNVTFGFSWHNESKQIKKDENNNEIPQEQIEDESLLTEYFKDNTGAFGEPYKFYLSKGNHVVTIFCKTGQLAIKNLIYGNENDSIFYNEYVEKINSTSALKNQKIIIEGENAIRKSDPSLVPNSDRSDALLSPISAQSLKLNTIGGDKWKYQNQWIEWAFNVKQDGFYNLTFKVKQDLKTSLTSNRAVYIDEKILFKELESVTFPYNYDWYFMELKKNDKPMKIYLHQGEHKIKMQVTTSDTDSLVRVVNEGIVRLNSIYNDIFMVTGASPDFYRDYELDKQIPNLMDNIKVAYKALSDVYLKYKQDGKNEAFSAFDNLLNTLNNFINKPDLIQRNVSTLKDNIASLSAWSKLLGEQPLEIDYICLHSDDVKLSNATANFFDNLAFGFKMFMGSFFNDYSVMNSKKEDISVWCMLGRDNIQAINDLIREDFTPKYNINVKLALVQMGIVEATLAGKGPDVAMFAAETDPVTYASRGVLTDLNFFEGYDKLSQRFSSELLKPMTFEGKVYGLPLSYDFPVMFYRKDILKKLGVEFPKTWEEFYKLVSILQSKQLDVGISSHIFNAMLLQNNGSYLSDDLTRCTLDSNEAVGAFKNYTDFFVKYNEPFTYDFFNRFRNGEMPLAIESYTLINLLKLGAPEINDLWGIAKVPATEKDGKFFGYIKGLSTTGIIFNKTKNKQAAFDFLSWFTSTDIQAKYGEKLEMIIGPEGRFNPSNKDSISKMNWSNSQLKVLNAQWDEIREFPVIPSSYYISRGFVNALRKVVYNRANPRETLMFYIKDINSEISRKNKEIQTNLRGKG